MRITTAQRQWIPVGIAGVVVGSAFVVLASRPLQNQNTSAPAAVATPDLGSPYMPAPPLSRPRTSSTRAMYVFASDRSDTSPNPVPIPLSRYLFENPAEQRNARIVVLRGSDA